MKKILLTIFAMFLTFALSVQAQKSNYEKYWEEKEKQKLGIIDTLSNDTIKNDTIKPEYDDLYYIPPKDKSNNIDEDKDVVINNYYIDEEEYDYPYYSSNIGFSWNWYYPHYYSWYWYDPFYYDLYYPYYNNWCFSYYSWHSRPVWYSWYYSKHNYHYYNFEHNQHYYGYKPQPRYDNVQYGHRDRPTGSNNNITTTRTYQPNRSGNIQNKPAYQDNQRVYSPSYNRPQVNRRPEYNASYNHPRTSSTVRNNRTIENRTYSSPNRTTNSYSSGSIERTGKSTYSIPNRSSSSYRGTSSYRSGSSGGVSRSSGTYSTPSRSSGSSSYRSGSSGGVSRSTGSSSYKSTSSGSTGSASRRR